MNAIRLRPEQAWTFARLPQLLTEYQVEPRTIVHVGAHHGEEVPIYRQCGFEVIRLVEPDKRNLDVLYDRFGADPRISIIPAACALQEGTVALYEAERTVWSSLEPHRTATGKTTTVRTIKLNALLDHTANVLVLDTQGTELQLLRQADLGHLDLVIVETTRRHGDSAAYYRDTIDFMDSRSWGVAEEWVHDDSGYTDTVFVRL